MIWHNSTAEQVLLELNSDKQNGLSSSEALSRLKECGKNEYQNTEKKNIFCYILNELKSFSVLFLLAVSVIYWVLVSLLDLSGWQNALVVILVTLFIALISGICKYISNYQKQKLKNTVSSSVTVIRDGKEMSLDKKLLVPGDIMVLKAGDYIRADGRLIDAYVLKCDEYAVSGETVPVDKIPDSLYEDITPLAKRFNMVYCGSVVVNGKGLAVVTETGDSTEIGSQNTLSNSVETTESILTSKLLKIKKICNTTAIISFVVIFLVGILANFFSNANFASIVLSHLFLSLSLYVASLATAIPMLLTIATTCSAFRLSLAGITVKDTNILEDIKDISVICADKTGTFTTENLRVSKIYNGKETVDLTSENCDEASAAVLKLALICSNLRHDEHAERHSNNIERSIESASIKYIGANKNDIDGMYPKLAELPFDSERRLMTTVTAINGSPVAIIKGAPEVIAERCTNIEGSEIEKITTEYAKSGLMVIAVAIKYLDEIPVNPNSEELEHELTFTGIIGFADQIDTKAVKLYKECNKAGIRVVMITGDHLETAISTAYRVGIISNEESAITGEQLAEMDDNTLIENIHKFSVFARIAPEDKARIVSALKQCGEKVFVTADSVYEAQALSEADVGCALGRTASDMVKDQAQIVVNDNRFRTIVKAIQESGNIFVSIKKCLNYYLTYNISIFSTVFFCLLIFGKTPISMAGIMVLSLLSLILPCLAIMAENGKTPIRLVPKGKILFDKISLLKFILPSLVVTLISVIGFAVTLNNGYECASSTTFAIVTLAFAVHAFSTNLSQTIVSKSAFTSLIMPIVCGASLFVYLINLITPIGYLLSLGSLSVVGWILAPITALTVLAVDEVLKIVEIKKIHN